MTGYGQIGTLQTNLNFLFTQAVRGCQKKDAAAALGVAPLTLSRWLSGTQDISPRHQAALLRYFGLPAWLPLEKVPLTPGLLLRYRLAQEILTVTDEQFRVIATEWLLQQRQSQLHALTVSHGCCACERRCHC